MRRIPLSALAVTLASVSIFATACSASNTETESSSQPSDSSNSSTQDAVVIGLDREVPVIDPKDGLMGQQPILILSNAIYEPLMQPAENGTFEPLQAESFESNDTSDEWTLTLKEGLKFSNGDPLDANAVIAHVQRMQDPAIGASTAGQAKQIESMESPDARTVVFKLSAPNANFPSLFARQLGMIAHTTAKDEFGFPLGAGPYVVSGFNAGNEITLTENENYVGDKPATKTLVYRMLPDADSRYQSVQSGDVDVAWTEVTSQMADSREGGSLKVMAAPAAVSSLMINVEKDSLSDPKVRTALAQAIDRDAINTVVNRGEGITVDSPYALLGDLAPDVDYPAFDADAARSVLQSKNLTLDMVVENRPDTMQRATAIQDMLSQVGVTVNVRPIESANFVSTLQSGDFDLADFVTSVFGDPTGAELVFRSTGPYNFMGYSNDAVDGALDSASKESDPANRKTSFTEVADNLAQDVPMAWYTASNAGIVYRDDVEGVEDISKDTLVSIDAKTLFKAE